MNLFILRHGLAAERGDLGYTHDFARPLTPAGRSQLHQIAAALRAMALRFDAILSSPLVRAQETAGIVAAGLKIKTEPAPVDELKPAGDMKKLIQRIAALAPPPENILLVGHEPDLSQLISLLVTGKTTAGFALKKSGLAKLEIEKELRAGKCAILAWLLTPGQMELMG
jgi:phosphohistidine phosphatase